jgi:hypothetical protein
MLTTLRMLLAGMALLATTSCRGPDAPPASAVEPAPADAGDAPVLASSREFILPATIVPVSSESANFGIDTTRLTPREAEVVASAWRNFERVLAGKRPECPAVYGASDGGSIMYDCGSYELMRVHARTPGGDEPAFEYGPELDFRNGQHIKRLRVVSWQELRRLESAP